MSVSKCKFNGSGKCGSSRGIEEVYSVLNVDRDRKNHLKSLKLLHQYEESPVHEKESIESRGGCSLLDEDFVCFYHRNYLGVFWKNSLKCSHPNHINRENKYKTCNTITDRKNFFSIFRKKNRYWKQTMHGSFKKS